MSPTLMHAHVHAQSHTHTPAHTCTHTNAHKCTQFKRIKQIFVRVIKVPNNRFGSKERLPEGSHQINRALRTDLASGKSTASESKSAPCRSFRAQSGKVTDTMYSRRHCSVTPGCHYQHPQVGYQAVTPGQGTPWELHAYSAQTHMQVKTAIHVK